VSAFDPKRTLHRASVPPASPCAWAACQAAGTARGGEIRIGQATDGDGDVSGKAFALPVNSGAAGRTEMKGQRVAAFGCPHPLRSLTGKSDLLPPKPRLIADHGAGTTLALQAVAHGDTRWFALDRKVKLPATAGSASAGHGSAPSLSMCTVYRLDVKACIIDDRDYRGHPSGTNYNGASSPCRAASAKISWRNILLGRNVSNAAAAGRAAHLLDCLLLASSQIFGPVEWRSECSDIRRIQ
jgi:hypothetical protein